MVARYLALGSILISFFVCLVLFENCSSQSPFAVVGTAMNKSTGGGSNGGGYEGKPYYDIDAAHACSDGKLGRSKIMAYPDYAQLVRKDCVDLPNPQLVPKIVTVTPGAQEDVLFSSGFVFNSIPDQAPSPLLRRRTVAYCLGTRHAGENGTNRVTLDGTAAKLEVQTAEVLVTLSNGKYSGYFSVTTEASGTAVAFLSDPNTVFTAFGNGSPSSPYNYGNDLNGYHIKIAPAATDQQGKVTMTGQVVHSLDGSQTGNLQLSTKLTWNCSIE